MKDKNAHISSEEIQQDIADTKSDIATWERESEGFELVGDRLSGMKAHARKTWIKEGREFIVQLEKILEDRAVTSTQ